MQFPYKEIAYLRFGSDLLFLPSTFVLQVWRLFFCAFCFVSCIFVIVPPSRCIEHHCSTFYLTMALLSLYLFILLQPLFMYTHQHRCLVSLPLDPFALLTATSNIVSPWKYSLANNRVWYVRAFFALLFQ